LQCWCFAVFAAIPLAISGSFIALFLTGWSFSFFAFVGFVSLIGIVVNSSIIMVDYINQLRATGMDRLQAIQQGSERRLVPIVLTTITTILGLLPLTASATNLWSPLDDHWWNAFFYFDDFIGGTCFV